MGRAAEVPPKPAAPAGDGSGPRCALADMRGHGVNAERLWGLVLSAGGEIGRWPRTRLEGTPMRSSLTGSDCRPCAASRRPKFGLQLGTSFVHPQMRRLVRALSTGAQGGLTERDQEQSH
jgi:hypothetical protein